MTLIAYIFSKLQTAKDVVRQMSKKPCSKTPFGSQHAQHDLTPRIYVLHKITIAPKFVLHKSTVAAKLSNRVKFMTYI